MQLLEARRVEKTRVIRLLALLLLSLPAHADRAIFLMMGQSLAASRLSDPVETESKSVSQVTPNPDDSPRLETNPSVGGLSPPIDY